MQRFLTHIELWLSGAGLVVITLAPILMGVNHDQRGWQVVAITAIAVGVLHGMIFWVIRSRQRNIRRATITEVQGMLKDQINNPLATVMLQVSDAHAYEMIGNLQEIQSSIRTISQLLDTVSEEALSDWKSVYQIAGK